MEFIHAHLAAAVHRQRPRFTLWGREGYVGGVVWTGRGMLLLGLIGLLAALPWEPGCVCGPLC